MRWQPHQGHKRYRYNIKLLYSIREIKLDPSVNGRTKSWALLLVLCPVFLSSGRKHEIRVATYPIKRLVIDGSHLEKVEQFTHLGWSLVWCGQVICRLTSSPHSRNSLAKLMPTFSEQYAPIQIMFSGIISFLRNHPAIICARVLTSSLFLPRTLETLSHAFFTGHYCKTMTT